MLAVIGNEYITIIIGSEGQVVRIAESFHGHKFMAQVHLDHFRNFIYVIELFEGFYECQGLKTPIFVRDALQLLKDNRGRHQSLIWFREIPPLACPLTSNFSFWILPVLRIEAGYCRFYVDERSCHLRPSGCELLFEIHNFFDLCEEPTIDFGELKYVLQPETRAEGMANEENALRIRHAELLGD